MSINVYELVTRGWKCSTYEHSWNRNNKEF